MVDSFQYARIFRDTRAAFHPYSSLSFGTKLYPETGAGPPF